MRGLLLLAVSCATPMAPVGNRTESPPAATVKPLHFEPYGDITVDDGGIVLMDHNNGDERVHVLTIPRDSPGTKHSWDDKPGPRSDERTASVPYDPQERAEIATWSDHLWKIAAGGRKTYPKSDPTAYAWVIVIRRGDEVRVVDGTAGVDTPEEDQSAIEEAVDFLDMHF